MNSKFFIIMIFLAIACPFRAFSNENSYTIWDYEIFSEYAYNKTNYSSNFWQASSFQFIGKLLLNLIETNNQPINNCSKEKPKVIPLSYQKSITSKFSIFIYSEMLHGGDMFVQDPNNEYTILRFLAITNNELNNIRQYWPPYYTKYEISEMNNFIYGPGLQYKVFNIFKGIKKQKRLGGSILDLSINANALWIEYLAESKCYTLQWGQRIKAPNYDYRISMQLYDFININKLLSMNDNIGGTFFYQESFLELKYCRTNFMKGIRSFYPNIFYPMYPQDISKFYTDWHPRITNSTRNDILLFIQNYIGIQIATIAVSNKNQNAIKECVECKDCKYCKDTNDSKEHKECTDCRDCKNCKDCKDEKKNTNFRENIKVMIYNVTNLRYNLNPRFRETDPYNNYISTGVGAGLTYRPEDEDKRYWIKFYIEFQKAFFYYYRFYQYTSMRGYSFKHLPSNDIRFGVSCYLY